MEVENTVTKLPASIMKKQILEMLKLHGLEIKLMNEIQVTARCPSDNLPPRTDEKVCCGHCGKVWICIGQIDKSAIPDVIKPGEPAFNT